MRTKSLLCCLIAFGLVACASADQDMGLPPVQPNLPSDLRPDEGQEPDFRQPTPIPSNADSKTPNQQAADVREMENLRDSHVRNTSRAIQRGQ